MLLRETGRVLEIKLGQLHLNLDIEIIKIRPIWNVNNDEKNGLLFNIKMYISMRIYILFKNFFFEV